MFNLCLGRRMHGIVVTNRFSIRQLPIPRKFHFPLISLPSSSHYWHLSTRPPPNTDSLVFPAPQNAYPDGRVEIICRDDSSKVEPGASEEMHLEFIEEPCGVPASDGLGFIQIEFGDRIGPDSRYEIVRKLGYGMYSSVWLAKDTSENRFVAIKALTGHATYLAQEGMIYELDVLQRISSQGKGMDETHCVSLHSHFIHPGKEPGDGEHLCLVMDALGPTVAAGRNRSDPNDDGVSIFFIKRILRDVLKGLIHLHGLGIVHTDIQQQNIMIDLGKGTFAFDVQSYINAEPPRRHPPERTVGNKMTQVAVSQPFPFSQYRNWRSRSFVIGDFGSAQFIGKQINNSITPVHLRAPETILALPWNEKVDIWSFGCMAFELMSRQYIMYPFIEDWGPEKSVLFMMLSLTNERLPSETIRSSKRAMEYLNPETGWLHDVSSPLMKSLPETVREISTPEYASAFTGFEVLLSKCLRIDPKDRPLARELSEDPWLNSDC